VHAFAADLTDRSQAEGAVSAALDRFGSVDAVLNLAGGFSGGTPVHEADPTELDRLLATNLRSALHLSRAAIAPMILQGGGRIVFIGSKDALHARGGYAYYAISKAALVRLAEAMAAELAGHGILVNVVVPGAMDTPANRAAQPEVDPARWVPPGDVTRALLFLVGDAGSTSGAVLPVLGRS
jgi:NAD(P)-dependent dehydrogenase (short-subunit alcohol dehydrogenase family)